MDKRILISIIVITILVISGLYSWRTGVFDSLLSDLKQPIPSAPADDVGTVNNVPLPSMDKKSAEKTFKESDFKEASTPDGQARFVASISILATAAPEITINSCVPTPTVLKIAAKDEIVKLHNIGTSTITIRFFRDTNYDVKSGESVEVKNIFPNNNAFYTYACNKRGPAGAVYIGN